LKLGKLEVEADDPVQRLDFFLGEVARPRR